MPCIFLVSAMWSCAVISTDACVVPINLFPCSLCLDLFGAWDDPRQSLSSCLS